MARSWATRSGAGTVAHAAARTVSSAAPTIVRIMSRIPLVSVVATSRVAPQLHALVEGLLVHAPRAHEGEPVRPVSLAATGLQILIEPGGREARLGIAPPLG